MSHLQYIFDHQINYSAVANLRIERVILVLDGYDRSMSVVTQSPDSKIHV